MQKIAFLDRDGTLNTDFGYVYKWEDFEWMPHAKEALTLLKSKGYELAIISNQSGIARGKFTADDVDALHHQMNADLRRTHHIEIDHFQYCTHHPDFNKTCECRKPETLLLENVAQLYEGIDRQKSIMVGDKDSDYECGVNFGVQSFLLSSEHYKSKLNIKTYSSLMEIVETL